MSLFANKMLAPAKDFHQDLLFPGTDTASVEDLFPEDEGSEVEDVHVSNSKKALALGLALCTLAYLNSGRTFELHAKEIVYLDSKSCDRHYFVRFCGGAEGNNSNKDLSAFDRIRARLISLADLLLAIEMGNYFGTPETTAGAQAAQWDDLKRALASKANRGKQRASKESADKIPYFGAVMACLLFETIVDTGIKTCGSDELVDPSIPTYVRENIVGNLLQSIETTKRRVSPPPNSRPLRARAMFRPHRPQDIRSPAASPIRNRTPQSQTQRHVRFGQKPDEGRDTRFRLQGDGPVAEPPQPSPPAAAPREPTYRPPDYDARYSRLPARAQYPV